MTSFLDHLLSPDRRGIEPPDTVRVLDEAVRNTSFWSVRGRGPRWGWVVVPDGEATILSLEGRPTDLPVLRLEPDGRHCTITVLDFAADAARLVPNVGAIGQARRRLCSSLRVAAESLAHEMQRLQIDNAVSMLWRDLFVLPRPALSPAEQERLEEIEARISDEDERLSRRYEVQGGAPGLGKRA